MARVALPVLVVAALAAPAAADTGSLSQGGTLTIEDLRGQIDDDEEFETPNAEDLQEYFNLAHCTCADAEPDAGSDEFRETEFDLAFKITGATGQNDYPGEIWYGTDCDDNELRDLQCEPDPARNFGDLSTLQPSIVRREFRIDDVLSQDPAATGCPDAEGSRLLWVLADTDENSSIDYGKSYSVDFDTQAPPAPAEAIARPGESAVVVEWEAPTDNAEDVAYYQALCARDDNDMPAHAEPTDEEQYQTSAQLCGLTNTHEVILSPGMVAESDRGPTPDAAELDAAPTFDAAPPPDAAETNLPQALEDLEVAYICGSTSAPATSLRIEGLDNEVSYRIVVVAVDLAGNAAGVYFADAIRPEPVTDFWEDLHDQGSEVEGGFCLLAETYGDDNWPTTALRDFRDDTLASSWLGRRLTDLYYAVSGALAPLVHGSLALRIVAAIVLAPVVVLALAWHVLTLPGLLALVLGAVWLRRRLRTGRRIPPRLAAVATGIAAVIVTGGIAAAQPSSNAYWEDSMFEEEAVDEVAESSWHVGLRIGPYTPEIDKQIGLDPGPYEQMFGNDFSVMPMLDVDWMFWRGFGQLGVGGSVGVFWKSAKAYEDDTTPGPDRPRSEGDPTTFRLIPLAATVTYRFTHLDDAYGIPLVPYVRGGLSYYIWWMGAPSGETAVIYDPPGCDPDTDGCRVNRARGASLGFQVSVGLSIRAERIDAGAARSMRQGGVEHAGFYAELSLAKVDGFGDEKKLSVGDRTWFAGVDFEF
jgi:hypothetical protein